MQENLSEQNKIYSSLCHLLQSENDYLIKSDIDNMNKSASLKEGLLRDAEVKEQDRHALCVTIAAELRIFSEEPKLLEIATRLPEPHRSKLIGHKSSLENLFVEIKRLNHENEILAQSALEKIGGTIGVMKDALSTGNNTYEKKGQSKKEQATQIQHLVHREA